MSEPIEEAIGAVNKIASHFGLHLTTRDVDEMCNIIQSAIEKADTFGAASNEPHYKTAICPFCHGSFVVNASHIMELQAASSEPRICPTCKVERTDYEGETDKYLSKCPNCGSTSAPTGAASSEPQEWIIVHRKEGVLLCDIRQKDGSVICELISQFEAHPIVDAHKAAIDAEREKLKDESANGTTLFRQLIAAQAAIKLARKVVQKVTDGGASDGASILKKLDAVDLSALEAHDAEVRKPLVAALAIQQKALDVWRMSVNSDSPECKIANKAIGDAAALAQVKEGK